MSASLSSVHSGSNYGPPELPLIPCKNCNQELKERTSKQPESLWRRFYRCNRADGTRCNFFSWQANYVVLLIREGFVTGTAQVIDTIASAITDLSRALESHTTSIRETKEKLDDLKVENLKQVVEDLKQAMDANEENRKLMASDLEEMKADLLKLKGSTANKPRMLGMCSLGLLGLGILIGWFLVGHGNREEEAFRRGLMLCP